MSSSRAEAAQQWLTINQAIKHCTQGLGIKESANNSEGSEPDVVMACCRGVIDQLPQLGADPRTSNGGPRQAHRTRRIHHSVLR